MFSEKQSGFINTMELINLIFQERINVIGNLHSRKTLTQRNMKKIFSLLMISALALFTIMIILPSCEGPQGPQGPAGVDGTDGTDGVDANSFCINCHTMEVKNTINAQFAVSTHGMGPNVGYAGGRSGCAKCHGYQGAMETMLTGRDTTAAGFAVPVAFQCDMCHDFHATLDETEFPDYALRNNKPVRMESDKNQTLDLPGSGNLCAYCHQTRRGTSAFGSGETVNVSSTHWGGHHGPQGNILAGNGAYEPTGSMTLENTAHTNMTGCSDCHMVKNSDRTDVGGHSWTMKAADGYENVGACTSCHSGATTFDIGGLQTEIAGLIEELHGLLVEHGLYSEESLFEGGHPVTSGNLGRNHSEQEAGAVYNYILFEEDRSLGVHNPKYTKAVLTNTIEMVEKW